MSDTMFCYFIKAIELLEPVVYLIGLSVAVWAFLRCRKCGYLVMAAYFALVVFWLTAWPPIQRAYQINRAPDFSTETRQKIDAAVQQAVEKVLAEEGRPHGVPATRTVSYPVGPILLVAGFWLVARQEMHSSTNCEAV